MDERSTDFLADETTALAKKEKLLKYILAIAACVIPVALYWLISFAIDSALFAVSALIIVVSIACILLLLFAIIVLALGTALGAPTATPWGIVIGVLSFVPALLCLALIIILAIAYTILSAVSMILGIAFPIIYILLMIFPLLISINGKLFSFKHNRTALITAICTAVGYGMISGLWSVLLGSLSSYNIAVILIRAVCNVEMIGVLFLVLMIFKLIEVYKKNKTIEDARESFKIRILQI